VVSARCWILSASCSMLDLHRPYQVKSVSLDADANMILMSSQRFMF